VADSSGGAIHAQASTAPGITSCTFTGNEVTLPLTSAGGAIYCTASTSAQIHGSDFTGNTSAYVGGAFCADTDSNCDFSDCDFDANTALIGGALGTMACLPDIVDCDFTGNSASGAGGAYYCYEVIAPPTISGCTFSNNSAGAGGALHVDGNIFVTMLTVTDCSFDDNSATTGGAISVQQADISLTGCDFDGNGAEAPPLLPLRAPQGSPSAWVAGGAAPTGDRSEDYYGGAISCEGDIALRSCDFASNSAWRGGGVALYTGAYGDFSQCTFSSNLASRGGGIYCYASDFDADSSAFTSNVVDTTGAGIYCENPSDDPTIDFCTFTSNDAGNTGRGGGICCWDDSAPTISNSSFEENHAIQGGALYIFDGLPLISNCLFTGNTCETNGGAVASWSVSDATFTNCDFTLNDAGSMGGAMFSSGNCDMILDDCTFWENNSYNGGALRLVYGSHYQITDCGFYDNTGSYGGVLSADEGSNPTLTNVTMCGNSASIDGAGIEATDGSHVNLQDSIISHSTSGAATRCVNGGTVTASCCCIYGNDGGDWTACLSGQLGGDNIDQDPQYCDLDNRDLRLQVGSPCDAG